MRLRIDFCEIRPRPSPRSILAILIALIYAGSAIVEYATAHAEELRTARALADARVTARQPRSTLSATQIEAANQVIRQLNLPWQVLLTAVEEQLSDRIALLLLEPNASTRMLRLEAEAKSAEDMVDFVEALGRNKHFVSAMLIRHHLVSETARNRQYRFVLEAEWIGDL